jgi:hypothetical protein
VPRPPRGSIPAPEVREFREPPPAEAIDTRTLVGSVLQESLGGIDLESDALSIEQMGGFEVIRTTLPTEDAPDPGP